MKLRGKTLRVEQFQELFVDWYAVVMDDTTGKEWEGPIRHFKAHAWLDAILHAFK